MAACILSRLFCTPVGNTKSVTRGTTRCDLRHMGRCRGTSAQKVTCTGGWIAKLSVPPISSKAINACNRQMKLCSGTCLASRRIRKRVAVFLVFRVYQGKRDGRSFPRSEYSRTPERWVFACVEPVLLYSRSATTSVSFVSVTGRALGLSRPREHWKTLGNAREQRRSPSYREQIFRQPPRKPMDSRASTGSSVPPWRSSTSGQRRTKNKLERCTVDYWTHKQAVRSRAG